MVKVKGKDGKGIFPASVDMTTDLHSLGQYIQDGQRILFETMISVKNPVKKLTIPLKKMTLISLITLQEKDFLRLIIMLKPVQLLPIMMGMFL